jgi:hypothetical protein
MEQEKSYTPEEVQEILQLAIARSQDKEVLSKEQLQEIALELGIENRELEAAELDWRTNKLTNLQYRDFDLYRRRVLKQKAVKYLIVNTFLVVLNLISSGGLSWSLYIIFLWGLGLALTIWKTFFLEGEEYQEAFKNWERKYLLKNSVDKLFERVQKFIKST